jgi:hypothetical protein
LVFLLDQISEDIWTQAYPLAFVDSHVLIGHRQQSIGYKNSISRHFLLFMLCTKHQGRQGMKYIP